MALSGALRLALIAAASCAAAAGGAGAQSPEARQDFARGLAADLGVNQRPNAQLAYKYYEKAAAEGDADAELDLGVMNDSGVGTLADSTLAALWYARAAARGNGRGAFDLGQLYEAGDGVPQDRPLAAAWYDEAVRLGIKAAAPRARRVHAAVAAQAQPAGAALALAAPLPVVPPPGGIVPIDDVEFVWQPAAALPGVQYWLQVRPADGGDTATIAYRETELSAMLVQLPPGDGSYAWRVFAASPDRARYEISDWVSFSVVTKGKVLPAGAG